ncbi:MAG TPA: ferredoxin [Actinomycetospora sp.]|jgi:NAD-dependent dihydropyrimidine dehydrogenase PreA subunit|uniref:ferredoxin n=1 Tax=Actinomycetospora sp. TaxID=1872135 RepID=UPI002F3F01F7
MSYVITDACIDYTDKSCIEECPVDCIYEGSRKLYIHPAECIDCGACEPVCPVEAIVEARDADDEQEKFVTGDSRFFLEPLPGRDASLGKPGGSKAVGAIGVDIELVAEWPRS